MSSQVNTNTSSYAPAPNLPGSNTKGYAGRLIDTYDRDFDGSTLEEAYDQYVTQEMGDPSLHGYISDGFVVNDASTKETDHDSTDEDEYFMGPGISSSVVSIQYHAECYSSPYTNTRSRTQPPTRRLHYSTSPILSSKSTIQDFLIAADLDDGRIDTDKYPSMRDLMERILSNFASVAAEFEDAGLTGLETGALMVKITDAIDEDEFTSDKTSDSDYQPSSSASESVTDSDSYQCSSNHSSDSSFRPDSQNNSDTESAASHCTDYTSDYGKMHLNSKEDHQSNDGGDSDYDPFEYDSYSDGPDSVS